MTKLTESVIEAFAINLFERLGYIYIHAPTLRQMATIQNVAVTMTLYSISVFARQCNVSTL